MKILFICDHCQTGFGRVASAIIPRLIARGHTIVQMGVNYLGDPVDCPWRLYPACTMENSGDALGYRKIAKVVALENPDLLVLFNDAWCVEEYIKALEVYQQRLRALTKDPDLDYAYRCLVYTPIDAQGMTRPRLEFLENPLITGIATYTEFGRQEIVQAIETPYTDENGVKVQAKAPFVNVIPHGADTTHFFPIHRDEARVRLGLGQALAGKFVVLNANRNQLRKRIDLTILGFVRFLKETGADAVLWLHMAPYERVGWNTEEVFRRECDRLGVDCESTPRLMYTDPNYSPANPVPIDSLNLIYNCADVMINTCSAEGFGLVSFEGSACGIPQIVPRHSCFPEIYDESAFYMDRGERYVDQGTGLIHQLCTTRSVVDALTDAYHFTRDHEAKDMTDFMLTRVKSEQYSWDTIAAQFHAMILEGVKR